MSLGFLVPLFLVGLLGLAVPVVIHLTRRQRRDVVHFPSLMFLSKIPYQEQRRRRVQHWFLLSLRALALALLAFAFARPFLDRSASGGLLGDGPREIVLLVDHSYSMGVGTRLNDAKARARAVIEDLGPLDRASVVVFSEGATVVARSTSDALRLRGALDTVRVSSRVTRYGPALKVAQTILEESELPSGQVYLLTDFQRTGWSGDEGVRLPSGSKVIPVSVGDEGPLDNAMVTSVTLPRQTVSGRERVTPTARVVRRGGDVARTLEVALSIDGQDIQSVPVTLEPGGASTVRFQPFTLSQPHTRGTVRLEADALPADDELNFVLSPGNSLPVLVTEGTGAQRDVSLYLSRALGISEEGRFGVRLRRSATVRPEDLEDGGAVFLNDARIDGASAERLRTFVTEGGGLFVALGESGSWPASALDLLPARPEVIEDRAQGRGGRLGYLEYEHPIFEIFAGPRSGDFTGARFYRAWRVTPADSGAVLARFDDGSVALAERRVGRGTVLLWTSSLDAFWNDLALQPVYLPFVHRLADYLGGRVDAVSAFTAGQVLDLADPGALEAAGLVSEGVGVVADGLDRIAVTPSGGSLSLPAAEGPRYLPLEESGFYTIRPPGTEPDRPFVVAVNVDVEESDLARVDSQELALAIEAPAAGPSDGPRLAEATELRREDQERRQSLWRWLIFGALALLAAETAVSNLLSRRGGGARRVVAG